jgi:predicted metal-dependent enzyme (double-stranded beta helix superfamily)
MLSFGRAAEELYSIDRVNDRLRERLDAAVGAGDQARIADAVKAVLQDTLRSNALALPDYFRTPLAETYARRLLYRDPTGRYTIVVMTWGPGQGTALHDHAGIWCVECVVDGQMEVTQYDLQSDAGGHYRFAERSRVHAGRGSAGCLIPPFEYHVLANAVPQPSITMHVYGGEMDHCHVFEPAGDGSYRRAVKALAYHD